MAAPMSPPQGSLAKQSVRDFKNSMPQLKGYDENQRIPGQVLIGMPTTMGAVQSRSGRFKLAIDSPTVKELYGILNAEMEKAPGPRMKPCISPGPDTVSIPVILPNNGHAPGTCAGCGAEEAEDGGPSQVCAKCKDRKYCGRKCQKLDWLKHKHSTCVQE